jgi:hypothetical protein
MCPMSSSVWALAPEDLVQHLVDRQEDSSKDWLFALHEILESEAFVRLIVTIWAIWGARRKAIHEDIYQSPHSVHGFITSYLSEVQVVNTKITKQVAAVIPRPNHRHRKRAA